ncbi:allantoate amidohydrolase [Actinomadura macra]|uniref:allantoate amidohydrolase n=1 Tax=Actinomadura macra TaxID=46164 RepID=UPI00083257B2|nr:allantoate amidohydrolase [Actinomadura macra]
MEFESTWAELSTVGKVRAGDGVTRLFGSSPERELVNWFRGECASRGLDTVTDPFGNMIGWFGGRPRGREGVLTASHFDSVPQGGAFDGALGVVSGLAALDRIRDAGAAVERPIGVGVFVEEEGSRFGQACLGSRLATSALSWSAARELRDAEGVALAEVAEGGESALLEGVACAVELHIEQGRQLDALGAQVGIVDRIWPHGRFRFEFLGEGNHAGSTPVDQRRDPVLPYAKAVLAARELASAPNLRATFGRVLVHPNSTNSIPRSVVAWLDARADGQAELDLLVADIIRAAELAATEGSVDLTIAVESMSAESRFDRRLAERSVTHRRSVTVSSCAGHDAGVLADAGIPATMLLVRNPTGLSHAPSEHASMPDCLAGIDALASLLRGLASTSDLALDTP